MDLRGLGSSGPSALICWGRYGSYMPVAGFVLRTSSRLAVDAGRLSVRAIPRTLMPAFRQSAMLMRSSWLRYLELIFWGMSTVERYQSTDGFSFLPFDRVLPLRHTLPVRLDTPTARAACVKFMPASRCSTYRRRRAAHISPRVAYSTPSNTHLSTWPSHQSARRCDDHWNPPSLSETLRAYRDKGNCVVISTHLLHEIQGVPDECIMIRHGRAVQVTDLTGVNLADLYQGR